MEMAGLPHTSLGKIVEPGTKLGPVRAELAASFGWSHPVEVVAPGTHDTASAVAAVPAAGEAPGNWAYLSSGTWSLLGVELDRPMTSREAFEAGFTNEQGVGGKTRFLRNIAGLWLVQELRRDLERHGKKFEYAQLADLAAEAPALRTIVDPNAEDLAAPGDSIAKLRGHAEQTGQPSLDTPGQLARCCLDSLALCYADTIDRIESLTDHRIGTLYLVGGGVNNRLLNQLAADATGRTVKLGPSEATALGNAMVQAVGLGIVPTVDALRQVVARSQDVEVVKPNTASADWETAKRRFHSLTIS
jgi:rhamnulokinase